jgi:hypothetical protein
VQTPVLEGRKRGREGGTERKEGKGWKLLGHWIGQRFLGYDTKAQSEKENTGS